MRGRRLPMLARHRVRRLRPRPAAVARAGRARGLAGARRRGGHGARGARPRPPRRTRSSRSTASAALLEALRERGAGLAVSTVARRRARLRHRSPLPARDGADADPAAPRRRRGPRALPRPRREHLAAGGLLAVALADALEAFDAEHDQPPARPARGGRRGLRQPPGRRSATSATARPSSASARSWPRRHPDGQRRRRSSSTASMPTSSPRRRPPFGLRAAGAAADPAHARVRGLDGGDAPWLSARCASARCIPTS